jgi:acetyl-CoA acyltransferase
MERIGTSVEVFAHIAVKARRRAMINPYAVFTGTLTVDEVLAAPVQSSRSRG